MRAAALLLVMMVGSAAAEPEVEIEEDTVETDPTWAVSAGVGAGLEGTEPVSAIDVRGDVAWATGAAGLGVRVQAVGDEVATDDWDEVADWIAIVRYVVMHERDGHWAMDAVGGDIGDIRVGSATLVDGYTAQARADRNATGAQVRLGYKELVGEIAVGDVARGTMIAASGRTPWGPLVTGATLAVDPRAPAMEGEAPLVAMAANVGVERAREKVHGTVLVDAAWEPGLGAGVAVVGAGAMRIGEDLQLGARVEIGAGTSGYVAAPFGALYLPMRDAMLMEARAGQLGGGGAAASMTLDVDGLASMGAGVRARPGLPAELDLRASFPAFAAVQAAGFAAWMPAADDALLVGGEAHVELGRRLWSGLEMGRQYLDAGKPVWQVTAWFGWTRSTD